MSALLKLPNIGKELEKQLIEVGIENPEQLQQTGSKQACFPLKPLTLPLVIIGFVP